MTASAPSCIGENKPAYLNTSANKDERREVVGLKFMMAGTFASEPNESPSHVVSTMPVAVRHTSGHSIWNDETLVQSTEELSRLTLERLGLLSALRDAVDPIRIGFSHRRDFAEQCLGISLRSWQESVRIWGHLQSLPLTRRAFARGHVSETKLVAILPLLTRATELKWLRCALRLSPDSLRRVADQARENAERQTNGVDTTSVPSAMGSGSSEPGVRGTGIGRTVSSDPGIEAADQEARVSDADFHAPSDRLERKPLRIRCPVRTVWTCEAFSEVVSRRIGRPASAQDYLDVATASFLSEYGYGVEARLSSRVHWPPLFVTATDPRSHNSSPLAPASDRHPELDLYVYTANVDDAESGRDAGSTDVGLGAAGAGAATAAEAEAEAEAEAGAAAAAEAEGARVAGASVEVAGPWLSFWKVEASKRGVPEPEAGDSGWAFYNGIPEEQTDGRSFVMSRPGRVETRRGLWSDHHRQRQRELSRKLRNLLDEGSTTSNPANATTSSDASFNTSTDASFATSSDASATTANTTPVEPLSSDDLQRALDRLHQLEADMRVLERRRLDCLRQLRKDRSFVRHGFASFDDYVETRLGRTARTVHRWLRVADLSRTLRAAEADPQLRTPVWRELKKLEQAGADERTLRRWIPRAWTLPAKHFRQQVQWALAHDDLLPKNTSLRAQPGLQPPEESVWPAVARKLLADPSAIRSDELHDRVRELEAEFGKGRITAGSSVDFALSENRDVPSADRTFSAHSGESATEPDRTFSARSGEPAAETDRTFSARRLDAALADLERTSIPVPIPDPSCPSDSHLTFHLVPDTIDHLAKIFAVLRAQYGDDKPDWWCLEVLFLHVQAGWVDEDKDFRRRTAEFSTLARDGFQCQNPYCTARRNLTVHHIVFRSANGSDEPENKITLCAACHLQGIHTIGSIKVTGTAPGGLTWTLGQQGWETSKPTRPAGPVTVQPSWS